MIRAMTTFEPRSFLLILFAFVGNGQVAGIDISLAVIAPLLVLAQMSDRWVIRRVALTPLVLLLGLLAIAALRTPTIGIPYTDSYELWPFKAMLLLVLVTFGRELVWPLGNMIALSLFCLALIAVGTIENGRLVSVFGPNMLYRIFGFLLIFSVMQYLDKRNADKAGKRFVLLVNAGLGILASLLTGSVGAVAVIGTVVTLALLRISKVLGALVIGATGFWIATSGILTGSFVASANAPVFYARAAYKIVALNTDVRIIGWTEILSRPITIWGHDYEAFWSVWRVGYTYPHHIFMELYGFYGLVGLLLCGLVLFACYRFLPRMLQGDIIALTFIVLLVGSMLSGDLTDNYGVIGLMGGLFFSSQRARTPGPHPRRAPYAQRWRSPHVARRNPSVRHDHQQAQRTQVDFTDVSQADNIRPALRGVPR